MNVMRAEDTSMTNPIVIVMVTSSWLVPGQLACIRSRKISLNVQWIRFAQIYISTLIYIHRCTRPVICHIFMNLNGFSAFRRIDLLDNSSMAAMLCYDTVACPVDVVFISGGDVISNGRFVHILIWCIIIIAYIGECDGHWLCFEFEL